LCDLHKLSTIKCIQRNKIIYQVNGIIRIYSLVEDRVVQELRRAQKSIKKFYVLSDNHIFLTTHGRKIFVWNLANDALIEAGTSEEVSAFAVLENGLIALAEHNKNSSISFWEFNGREIKKVFDINRAHLNLIDHLIALPDSYLASGTKNEVKIWSQEWEIVGMIAKDGEIFRDVKFLSYGRLLIQSKLDEVLIWNYKTGESLRVIKEMANIQWSVLTPDKQFVVFFDEDCLKFYKNSDACFYFVIQVPVGIKSQIRRQKFFVEEEFVTFYDGFFIEIFDFKAF